MVVTTKLPVPRCRSCSKGHGRELFVAVMFFLAFGLAGIAVYLSISEWLAALLGWRIFAMASEPEQLMLWKPRGGKRRGAGRKPKGHRAGSPHKVRPELSARHPVHIVLRVSGAVGSLRRRFTYQAFREATYTTARREDFRIVHLSIQRTHLHLLVEANHKDALASGMQGFQISAAKHLNAAISRGKPGPRRRGTVFPDRYHAEVITSPRQARHALSSQIGRLNP